MTNRQAVRQQDMAVGSGNHGCWGISAEPVTDIASPITLHLNGPSAPTESPTLPPPLLPSSSPSPHRHHRHGGLSTPTRQHHWYVIPTTTQSLVAEAPETAFPLTVRQIGTTWDSRSEKVRQAMLSLAGPDAQLCSGRPCGVALFQGNRKMDSANVRRRPLSADSWHGSRSELRHAVLRGPKSFPCTRQHNQHL